MAFDVLVRFTIVADSNHRAMTLLEDLLVARLDPTSTEFQPEPHAIIDSWSLWPEELQGVMVMRGPVSDGHHPVFLPHREEDEPRPGRTGAAGSPPGCPIRGLLDPRRDS